MIQRKTAILYCNIFIVGIKVKIITGDNAKTTQ
jgi:magnesium-transporting ATPase (P-type)